MVEAKKLACRVYAKYYTGYFDSNNDTFTREILDDFEQRISEAYFGIFRNEQNAAEEEIV